MRLYRGLTQPYQRDRVDGAKGTDFTNCPWIALGYAAGRRGVLLVVDLPDEALETRLSEELWFDQRAKRWNVWGPFDAWITAILPAKEARAAIRTKGVRAASSEYQAMILRRAIERHLASGTQGSLLGSVNVAAWGLLR
jgi:hypothetical protein